LTDNNNKSNQQQTQQNINQVIKFMSRWELKKSYSLFTIDVNIRYTESGECKIIKKPSWSRIKSPKERAWEKFYSSILELVSRTFYPDNFTATNDKDYSSYK
jgi:hypothetical protein